MLPADLASLDYVATPVFALDVRSDGVPIYSAMNERALHMFGMTKTEILGLCASEAFPCQSGEFLQFHHTQALMRGEPYTYEVEQHLKEGTQTIQTTLLPVFDGDGSVVRLIGTSDNVTLAKRAQETQKANIEVTTEVEEFISMAAHDLRTPMRNVQEIANMLRMEFEDLGDGKTELIDLLEDVALKATGLISDVLAYSQATRATGEDVSFDLKTLVQKIHAVLDPLQKHTIHCSELTVLGNQTVFQIVLRNLLDNAFKHGGREQLTLKIDARENAPGIVTVMVRDDGCGFDNPGIAFLNSGKLRVDSGFGLLGVRRLVRTRGGDITVEEPEDGVGSLVRFTLPGTLTRSSAGRPHAPLVIAVR